jgi:UDP-N-acetylglucosamine diphosphorylase/glucosamine-1-phosphate N-acetyltransferase
MRQAVILAAGEGQRLRPFTVGKPKVMLFVAGKPILQYIIESLAQNGIRNIVLVVGYRKEQIFDWLGAGEQFGVDITYITQDIQLGTAHALCQAREATDPEFLVLPGDNLIEADTIAQFVNVEPWALLVKKVNNPVRCGVVTTRAGRVRDISEKPREPETDVVNTGIYAFTKEIFNFLDVRLDIPNVLNNVIDQGYTINALETGSMWLDVVYPWDMLSLNDTVLRRIPTEMGGTFESGVSVKGQMSVGKHTVIRSNSYIAGPAVIGHGCDIGPNVCLLPATSIGDNVVVSPFSEIENSVIGSDVRIGPGCIIQNSVIDRGCVIKGQFTACSGQAEVKIDDEHYTLDIGALLGEGCNFGSGVVAEPGVIVGNYSKIQALKLVTGRLPDNSLVF